MHDGKEAAGAVAPGPPTGDPMPVLDRLLERVGGGDRAAFDALYDHAADLVYGLALQVTGDPGLAHDASARTLVDVWRHAPRFDARTRPARWWILRLAHAHATAVVAARPPTIVDLALG